MNNAIEHIEISAPDKQSPDERLLHTIGELVSLQTCQHFSTKNQRRIELGDSVS